MTKKISLALAALLLSASAFALTPLFYALGASLAVHFGLVYQYFTAAPVTTAGKTLTVTFRTDAGVSEADMVKAHQVLPSGTSLPIYSGNFNFTYTNQSTGQSYTASGYTLSEIKESMLKCPSNICSNTSWIGGTHVGSSNNSSVSAAFRLAGSLTITATDVFAYNKAYYRLRVDSPGYTGWLYFNVPNVACQPGYSYNTTSGQCDIVNVEQARTSVGDGVCPVLEGTPNINDPDCATLQADGKLTTSTSADGQPATSVVHSTGTVVTQAKSASGSTISQVFKSSDGGTRREDTAVGATGAVGSTNTTNYPANPPPLYPGDPGGTSVPGSTGTGTTAVPCGGPGQNKCAVQVDMMGDLVTRADWLNNQLGTVNNNLDTIADKLGGGDGSPVDSVGDAPPSSLTSEVEGLKSKASVIPVSSYCPPNMFSFTIPLPAIAGGDYQLTDHGLFCQLMGDYQELIRGLSIAFGFIVATFIVLGA